MQYADVIVEITHTQLNRPFQYHIPEHLQQVLCIGMEVEIPFGRANKPIRGYVIGFSDTCEVEPERIKEISGIAAKRGSIEGDFIELAAWMADRYGSTMIQALKTVLPVKKKIRKKKGGEYRDPVSAFEERDGGLSEPVELTAEQRAAAGAVIRDMDHGRFTNYLLFGVTGSGKTEVYIELIRHVMSLGRQAVVLIPEIALTYQTVDRFRRYFGDRVSVIHSRLSDGERWDQMERARNRKIDVIIGPRSALFTPFPDTGIIIIDEEHDSSYKSETAPRYKASEAAMWLGRRKKAAVVLGSATPSLAAYTMAKEGRIRLLTLHDRIDRRPLAQTEIVDMRKELKEGNRSMLSRSLIRSMEEVLEKKEQAILFLNRRGFAGFVSCRSCGHVIRCDHCDVSMTYHRGKGLVCHYCGRERPMPSVCPVCGSKHIAGFRAGTQQLEEQVREIFPEAKILRMDADTTKNKSDHDRILSAFARGEGDILLGTQMIVKGHDFHNVTLVAAVAADLSLSFGDYNAVETTFELLVQAAGRAGRGEKPGRMILQTYQPDHYGILAAAGQDYEAFYGQEMVYRKLMDYPPSAHILAVTLSSGDEERLREAMDHLAKLARRFAEKSGTEVLGPADPPVRRVNDVYRKVLYCKNKEYGILKRLKDYLMSYMDMNQGFRDVFASFDFDA